MLSSKEVGRGVEIYKDNEIIASFSVLDDHGRPIQEHYDIQSDVTNKRMIFLFFKKFFPFIYRKYFKRY
jgi:hypothetical protein